MNTRSIAAAIALVAAILLVQGGEEEDKELVVSACTRCHGLDFYVTPRSRKAWQLTVVRMQEYVGEGDEEFSKENVRRIIDYFALYFDEDSDVDPAEHFPAADDGNDVATDPITPDPEPVVIDPEPETDTAVAAAPEPKVTKVRPPIRQDLSEEIKYRLAHPRWKPSPVFKRAARWGGYIAVFFTLALLITGHNRRRLKRRFRPIHATCALGLFLSLAVHGLIYLIQYGNPMVLWYWLGILSFVLLVLAQFQGIIRKKFGRRFLRIHVSAGYISLTLAIGHWVVAWL